MTATPAGVATSAARWLPALLVSVVAFGAARFAMLPGLGFWDTAELQAVAPLMGTAHPTGYPTYVLLGWLANIVLTPFGEPAMRMNLFAAISLAVAAAVTADLARALTRSAPLGVMAGLGLALTEIAWSIGTHADVHALHLALVAILFRALVAWEDRVAWDGPGRMPRDRVLIASAVVFGLAVGNHSLTFLLAPGIAVYVLAVEPGVLRRPRLIAACAAALAVTVVLVFLELPLRAGPFRAPMVYGQPETWDGFWYIVLAEQFREALVGPFVDVPAKILDVAYRAVLAFGPLAALIPFGFAATVRLRPAYALLSGICLLLTCAFAASYGNAEIERYFLGPVLIAWTWLAMLAGGVTAALGRRRGPRADGKARARVSRTAPDPVLALGLAAVLLLPTAVGLPARFARVDRSGDLLARQWVDTALAAMRPDALVASWWSYSTPLWYAQHIEGQRPDLTVIDDRTRLDLGSGDLSDVIDANLPNRPVYVIRVDPAEIVALERRYILEYLEGGDARHLTRVVARIEAGE